MLLERFPVMLVPVAIHGAHAAMPPGRRIPRLRRIRVSFGAALEPDQLAEQGEGDKRSKRIVTALESRMRKLMRETRL